MQPLRIIYIFGLELTVTFISYCSLPVKMGLGNIYRRRIRVFTMALVVYLDYKVSYVVFHTLFFLTTNKSIQLLTFFYLCLQGVQQREKWTSKSKQTALWEKAHERNAKRILKLILEMEGLWVKFGQYMSTRADVLPAAYINLLKQLQDSLPPRPLEEVLKSFYFKKTLSCTKRKNAFGR